MTAAKTYPRSFIPGLLFLKKVARKAEKLLFFSKFAFLLARHT